MALSRVLGRGDDRCAPRPFSTASRRGGFTLVEVLVAMTVTLVLMGLVVTMFGHVSTGVSDSRSIMEMSERLRASKQRLQRDLEGVTAPTIPPLDPEAGHGYFEYIEGPVGAIIPEGRNFARDFTAAGDFDDVLMFTSRAVGEPFIGKYGTLTGGATAPVNSRPGNLAEVCWFVRSGQLYRRVLLVAPDTSTDASPALNYFFYDLSMRQAGGTLCRDKLSDEVMGTSPFIIPPHVKANTLGDLTKRENRYGHQPVAFPHDSRWTTPATVGNYRPGLGLPTLGESSVTNSGLTQAIWPFPLYETTVGPNPFRDNTVVQSKASTDPKDMLVIPNLTTTSKLIAATHGNAGTITLGTVSTYDPWSAPRTVSDINATTGVLNNYTTTSSRHFRYDEDVILTNVLSFDVKAWDPGAPVLLINIPSNVPGQPSRGAVVLPGEMGFMTGTADGALIEFRARPAACATPGNKVEVVGFGAYVDLNYMQLLRTATESGLTRYSFYATNPNSTTRRALEIYEDTLVLPRGTLPRPSFADGGNPLSRLVGANLSADLMMPCVYDTWSTHYERDGKDTDRDGIVDEGSNGIDDDGDGRIDEADELETAPPYAAALRGIQVKIRCFEPDSREIREVSLVHEFLPE